MARKRSPTPATIIAIYSSYSKPTTKRVRLNINEQVSKSKEGNLVINYQLFNIIFPIHKLTVEPIETYSFYSTLYRTQATYSTRTKYNKRTLFAAHFVYVNI